MSRVAPVSSPRGSIKRNRRLNHEPVARKKNYQGGWNVPPAYTTDVGKFTECNSSRNEGNKTCIDKSLFYYGSISEHDPESKRQLINRPRKNMKCSRTSVSCSTNKKLFHDFFPLLEFFRKRKEEQALIEVVKKIWDEGQMLRKQRIQMMNGWTGDVGLALFIPIDWEEFEEVISVSSEGESEDTDLNASVDAMTLEDDPDAESSPPILSHSQLNEIHTKGLPAAVTLMTWTRAYSLNRDGDHFANMMEKVANYQHTLTVIRAKNGDILGGYADTPWGDQVKGSPTRTRGFFGGGRAFLFATNPNLNGEEEEMMQGASHVTNTCTPNKDTINFYPWTGVNEYSQLCDVRKGFLGMGGGGSFGWLIQNNFTDGSSGTCMTFRNPPLTKGDDENFKVVDLEIYGFKTMSERYVSYPPSQISLLTCLGGHSRSLSNASSITSMFE